MTTKKTNPQSGYNPFDSNRPRVESKKVTIGNLLYLLRDGQDYFTEELSAWEYNFNPWVLDHQGEKRFIQRGDVWDMERRVSLIHSIVNEVACGSVLIRKMGFDELKKRHGKGKLAFHDILDGKQRLTTLKMFINDEFKYDGHYYSEWSLVAQRQLKIVSVFTAHFIPEGETDENALYHLKKLLHGGVPNSKEHKESLDKIQF